MNAHGLAALLASLAALLLLCGCATGGGGTSTLRRLDNVGPLPVNARVGMTDFTVCGGSYLDKLNPGQRQQDAKAVFYRTCAELGHPRTFSARMRLRLEEKLGRKLALIKGDKSFTPKPVLREAKKLGLEYVVAGDLFYLGEADGNTVVSALLYLIRVSDAKLMVVGRVKKEGGIGKVLDVIADVADELYARASEN